MCAYLCGGLGAVALETEDGNMVSSFVQSIWTAFILFFFTVIFTKFVCPIARESEGKRRGEETKNVVSTRSHSLLFSLHKKGSERSILVSSSDFYCVLFLR